MGVDIGNVPAVAGDWDLIDEMYVDGTILVAQQTKDFSVIGDNYRFLKLIGYVVNGTALSRDIHLRINGATTNITYLRAFEDGTTYARDNPSLFISALASSVATFELSMACRSGADRVGPFRGEVPRTTGFTSTLNYIMYGAVHYNASTAWTSFGVGSSGADTFGTGSYLRLLGMR